MAIGPGVVVEIAPLTELPADVSGLAAEADRSGHRFLRRLLEEWRTGVNRFEGPGEVLLGATVLGRLVGVCGLNRDPYSRDPRLGRVRHLYVLQEFRRAGVGRRLLDSVVAAARGVFRELRLRTDTEAAARFYERFGFRRQAGESATHALALEEPEAA